MEWERFHSLLSSIELTQSRGIAICEQLHYLETVCHTGCIMQHFERNIYMIQEFGQSSQVAPTGQAQVHTYGIGPQALEGLKKLCSSLYGLYHLMY